MPNDFCVSCIHNSDEVGNHMIDSQTWYNFLTTKNIRKAVITQPVFTAIERHAFDSFNHHNIASVTNVDPPKK